MRHLKTFPRFHGIASVRADTRDGPTNVAALIQDVNVAFQGFRDRHDQRLEELTNAVNTQREQIDSLRIGPSIQPGAGLRLGGQRYAPLSGERAHEFSNALRGLPNAAMTTQSGPDGGYTVYPEVDGIIDALLRDYSPLRSLARVVPLGEGKGGWEKIITRTGSQSAWASEEETRNETGSATLGTVTIDPHEVYAIPELTNKVVEDSAFDVNAFIDEDVSGEFALAEGAAFLTGDGMKKPRGLLTYPTSTNPDVSRTFGELQYIATGAAGAFTSTNPADKLCDLLTALRPSYRKGDGVAWLMNSTTANVIRKMKDGQGNYLWTNSLVAGQPDRLLGYPVALDEGMPDIAANSFSVAFGNWKRGYAIVDKPGMKLIVDRVTRKGWTKMYFSRRVGGGMVDSNAIKLLKFAVS